jgi:hypothetical protein
MYNNLPLNARIEKINSRELTGWKRCVMKEII